MGLIDIASGSESPNYSEYISRLGAGEAGKLTPSPGESIAGVKRLLGAAAKQRGAKVTMRTVDGAVYFWLAEGASQPAPVEAVQEPEGVAERLRQLYIHDIPRLPIPRRI